jgi:hypothetical protein
MPPKLYKWLLSAVAVALLAGASVSQNELTREREDLGLTRYTELRGAPPLLALTTVALGGFRGLISNALWIRASDLQDEDKFFEMVQLADWITKLEPHFSQVWVVQAWNMAYNISVKFKDPEDRWRWLERAIQLLRDDGLRYNPNDVLMYRELAWFFQHKMGANLDDAHLYYKQMWANEMARVFGTNAPNWDELINPQTDDAKKRAALLRDTYKMDPAYMKQIDERYGPLEWRLPDAHAIYWAAKGLDEVQKHPRDNASDFIMLRRVIYQSMQTAFQRGRLVPNQATRTFEFEPDLDLIPKVSAAYEQAMNDDPTNRDHIETAHRNFLRDAVYYLYTYNKEGDSLKWFKYLCEKYPDKPLLNGDFKSLPKNMDLDTYCIGRIDDESANGGKDRMQAIIQGLERTAFLSLAIGEDDRYIGLDRLAQKIWARYQDKIDRNPAAQGRVSLPPMKQLRQFVLTPLLYQEAPPLLAAQLRTALDQIGIPIPPPPETNAAPATVATNAPAAGNNEWITTMSGLKYMVLKKGTGTVSPKPANTVKVYYTGALPDSTVFDKRVEGEGRPPASFRVDGVIKGWTEGLQLMKVGDKFKFEIPADLAYGANPPPGIPANSPLVFEVELLEIE